MEVIITRKARNDLYSFYYHSKVNVQDYINHIINYSENISLSPHIGKTVDYIKNYEIMQLIYNKHKILYTISKGNVYILGFIHTSRKFNIQKNFNLIDFPEIF